MPSLGSYQLLFLRALFQPYSFFSLSGTLITGKIYLPLWSYSSPKLFICFQCFFSVQIAWFLLICLPVQCFFSLSLYSTVALVHWVFYFSYCIFQFWNFHLVLYIFLSLLKFFVLHMCVIAPWNIFIMALKNPFQITSLSSWYWHLWIVFFSFSLRYSRFLVWWVIFIWYLDILGLCSETQDLI